MRAVQKLIGMAAATDATVLITGETGTGKELVARALHDYGARSRGPLVGVNCAAVPAELLESELFGHARGAFTGAVTERPGRFREAHGGTLFLDEIGDMEPAMQSKILRALQERRVTPIGGRPEAIDVRIVAATHQDLPGRIAAGRFREDLFYRLNVVPIHLPPLRERSADIVPLAEHFLRQASPGSPKSLSSDARAVIAAYAWPGNVRELRNAMERAAALVRAGTVGAADLAALGIAAEPPVGVAHPTGPDLPAAVERLEEAMIRRALVESGGNRAEAARRLNINRQLLYQKIKKYGIDLDK